LSEKNHIRAKLGAINKRKEMPEEYHKKLIIRPETSLDYQAIAQIHILAFGRENEAILVKEIRASDRYIQQLSLVAEIDGMLIGHILFSYIDLIGEDKVSVLALAPMAVRSGFQKQGIGSKLVRTGLNIATAMKVPLVIVLGHPGFYHRFGFESAKQYLIESPFPVPEEVFMVKFLNDYQTHYKGKIVYPPTFGVV
jgi:putative acetyltransferase